MTGLTKTGKRKGNSTRIYYGMADVAEKAVSANTSRGALIPDRVGIAERPQIVNERMRLGGWEGGDTVDGQDAFLVTLAERTSRFTLCGRTQTKCKDEITSVINGLFDTITARKETLTLNNGSEFAAHSKINKRHSIDVFFAKAYAS